MHSKIDKDPNGTTVYNINSGSDINLSLGTIGRDKWYKSDVWQKNLYQTIQRSIDAKHMEVHNNRPRG